MSVKSMHRIHLPTARRRWSVLTLDGVCVLGPLLCVCVYEQKGGLSAHKRYQKRWFRFNGGFLQYFEKAQKDKNDMRGLKGVIDCSLCHVDEHPKLEKGEDEGAFTIKYVGCMLYIWFLDGVY